MSTLSENTKFTFTAKNTIAVISFIFGLSGVYYTLQFQIAEARRLPVPTNTTELKASMISTNSEIKWLREDVERVRKQLETMEQRMYIQIEKYDKQAGY
jgi:hypothetical protein